MYNLHVSDLPMVFLPLGMPEDEVNGSIQTNGRISQRRIGPEWQTTDNHRQFSDPPSQIPTYSTPPRPNSFNYSTPNSSVSSSISSSKTSSESSYVPFSTPFHQRGEELGPVNDQTIRPVLNPFNRQTSVLNPQHNTPLTLLFPRLRSLLPCLTTF